MSPESGDDHPGDRPTHELEHAFEIVREVVSDDHDEHGPAEEISERAAQLTGAQRPLLMEAVGGPLGMAESALPSIAFVIAVTAGLEIKESAIIAIGLAVLLGAARAIRRQTVQFALTGVIGVAVSAYIANKTGDAKNFFLPGFAANVVYGGIAFTSVAIGRPFIGYIVEGLTGSQSDWRNDPVKMRKFRLASLLWGGLFVLRLIVQLPLYFGDYLVALGTAKTAMGLPFFGIGIWLTWMLLRVPVAEPDPPAASEPDAAPAPESA